MVSSNKQTVIFNNRPKIIGSYSIGGPLESKGPISDYLSYKLQDDKLGEETFEKAERKLLEHIIFGAIDNSGLKLNDIDVLLGGDLLNQIVGSSFSARKFGITFIGLYSALFQLFSLNDYCYNDFVIMRGEDFYRAFYFVNT